MSSACVLRRFLTATTSLHAPVRNPDMRHHVSAMRLPGARLHHQADHGLLRPPDAAGGSHVLQPDILPCHTISGRLNPRYLPVAAMGLCCGNQVRLFECPNADQTYDWMISWPQCVYLDPTGCLQGTDQPVCCSFLVEFRPNYPTAGQCRTTVLDDCTLQAVPVPCELSTTPVGFAIRLQCSYPVECCW